jgi:hypothetical protein
MPKLEDLAVYSFLKIIKFTPQIFYTFGYFFDKVFWKCYEYGDDLVQIFEFIDDQRQAQKS